MYCAMAFAPIAWLVADDWYTRLSGLLSSSETLSLPLRMALVDWPTVVAVPSGMRW